jgi:NAD(P)-dependent dehydrogenase (short-subunit alcohol dehydrogenase family)
MGENAYWEAADVTAFDTMPALVERVRAKAGPISILVNNAGHNFKKLAVDTSVEEFSGMLARMCWPRTTSPAACCRACWNSSMAASCSPRR